MRNTKQTYPEGGWGWVVAFTSFAVQFMVFGTLKAFGVLLTSMKDDFDTDLWVIGSIGSLHFGLQFMLAPVAGVVARKIGCRRVVMFGGVLFASGLVLSSIVQSVPLLAATLVLMAGTGVACIYQTSKAELAFYFQEKYAIAFFVSSIGSPVGMMLYGPMTQVLIDTYGWRGAMLLLGGIGFHVVVCGQLMKPHKQNTQEYERVDSTDVDDLKSNRDGSCNNFLEVTGMDIFRSSDFNLLTAAVVLLNVGFAGVIIYMIPNGLSQGLSTTEASLLTTAWGIGNAIGMTLAALAMYFHPSMWYLIALIAGILTTVGYVLLPFMASFIGQWLTIVMLGASIDGLFVVLGVKTRNLPFSADRQFHILGWQSFLAGVASSICDVLAGWLYDATGTFHATFFMFCVLEVGACFFFLMECFRLKRKQQIN